MKRNPPTLPFTALHLYCVCVAPSFPCHIHIPLAPLFSCEGLAERHYHTVHFYVLLLYASIPEQGENLPVILVLGGSDSHAKQQHIIKAWISTRVFKIFNRRSGAEMKRILCHDQKKLESPFMLVYSTVISAHTDMPLFQMTFLLNVILL